MQIACIWIMNIKRTRIVRYRLLWVYRVRSTPGIMVPIRQSFSIALYIENSFGVYETRCSISTRNYCRPSDPKSAAELNRSNSMLIVAAVVAVDCRE